MDFVKVILCVIAFVIGIGIMEGFDYLLTFFKRGDKNDSEKK